MERRERWLSLAIFFSFWENISGAGVTRASHTGPSLGLSISRQPHFQYRSHVLIMDYFSSILKIDTMWCLPDPRQVMNQTRSGGTVMRDKMKSVFNSEKAMAVVNLLFLLSLLIPNRWIIFIALAIFMIAVNLYFLLGYYAAGWTIMGGIHMNRFFGIVSVSIQIDSYSAST